MDPGRRSSGATDRSRSRRCRSALPFHTSVRPHQETSSPRPLPRHFGFPKNPARPSTAPVPQVCHADYPKNAILLPASLSAIGLKLDILGDTALDIDWLFSLTTSSPSGCKRSCRDHHAIHRPAFPKTVIGNRYPDLKYCSGPSNGTTRIRSPTAAASASPLVADSTSSSCRSVLSSARVHPDEIVIAAARTEMILMGTRANLQTCFRPDRAS